MINNLKNTINRKISCLLGRIKRVNIKTLAIINLILIIFTIIGLITGSLMTDNTSSIEDPIGFKVEKMGLSSANDMEQVEINKNIGKEELKNLNSESLGKETKVFLVDFFYNEETQHTRFVDRFEPSTNNKILDDIIEKINKDSIMSDKEVQTLNTSENMLDEEVQTLNTSESLLDNHSKNTQVNPVNSNPIPQGVSNVNQQRNINRQVSL